MLEHCNGWRGVGLFDAERRSVVAMTRTERSRLERWPWISNAPVAMNGGKRAPFIARSDHLQVSGD